LKSSFAVFAFAILTVLFSSCAKHPDSMDDSDGAASYSRSAVSDPTLLKLSESESAQVKVYHYKPGSPRFHHVLFKYADLLNRAIAHKEQNPADQVEVNLALYKISKKTYVGFNPEDETTYGRVNGRDFGGENSEKLVESIRKANGSGVKIRFVFHNTDLPCVFRSSGLPCEAEKPPPSNACVFLNTDLPCLGKKPPSNQDEEGIYDYLGGANQTFARRVWWGPESYSQMHNKFLTMRILRKGAPISHAVYVSTANGDSFGNNFLPEWDVSQTGVLVRSNAKLHDAYARYFQLIWDYANHARGMEGFRDAVRASHDSGSLNYEDAHFQAYFYPMPLAPTEKTPLEKGDNYAAAWVKKFNPIAKLVGKLSDVKGARHVKLSGFWCGARPDSPADLYSQLLQSKLNDLHQNQGSQLLHIRTAYNNIVAEDDPVCPLGQFDGRRIGALTHEKNAMFAFGGPQEFYSITGSTNTHGAEFMYKANNLLVIREKGARPIYDFFKVIFYSAYD